MISITKENSILQTHAKKKKKKLFTKENSYVILHLSLMNLPFLAVLTVLVFCLLANIN